MTDVAPSRCSPELATAGLATVGLLDCHPVRDAAELASHFAVRRAVFVREQALFADDRDTHDDDPATVHVLGRVAGVCAGTVRLYVTHGTTWKGDRLSVLPEHRHAGLGGPLVRLAVSTAAARGGTRMDAMVQAGNTTFFIGLGWTPVGGVVEHVGVAHQAMTIALG